jgi:hypothetical protein
VAEAAVVVSMMIATVAAVGVLMMAQHSTEAADVAMAKDTIIVAVSEAMVTVRLVILTRAAQMITQKWTSLR